jgi:hypothetical protein
MYFVDGKSSKVKKQKNQTIGGKRIQLTGSYCFELFYYSSTAKWYSKLPQ